MLRKLENLVFGKVKSRLINVIEQAIANNSQLKVLYRELQSAQSHIGRLNTLLYQNLPEIISIPDEVVVELYKFFQKVDISTESNMAISKHDVMFHTELLSAKGDFNRAVLGYFAGGLYGYEIISKCAEYQFGGNEHVKNILDFACGYGRVSRFLSPSFNSENIWVCDVKKSAVHFQESEFGYHGIEGTFIPEEFSPSVKFDVIFVGSLFSHLNEDLFGRWLQRLYSVLSKNGVLAISVHDATILSKQNPKDFVFRESSEDQTFSEVEGTIGDGNLYGSTFVSLSRMQKFFTDCGIPNSSYRRFEKCFGGFQDIYVVSKGEIKIPETIDFTPFYALSRE